MIAFTDIPEALIRSITAPALVINADKDVVLAEHAFALSRLLPNAQLAILPGGHGDYIGECCTPNPHSMLPALVTAMIDEFLQA
jgi:pimeloyl-ACP methyl ester carboxylesterase